VTSTALVYGLAVTGVATTRALVARGWRVTVATAGVGTAGYLVHLGHVVAEAVLDGHLHPGDRLSVRHVPRLLRDGAVTVRVHADGYDPNRLRAYAAVSPAPPP